MSAIRQPRFLGENVANTVKSKEQQLNEQLGQNYEVTKTESGFIAKQKPHQYLKIKDSRTKSIRKGTEYQYGYYSPHELIIDSTGKVIKEVHRGVFKLETEGKIKEWSVYNKEVTDYNKQTKFTFGKRKLTSGRESIRQTSSIVKGVYTEKNLINQTSKKYREIKQEKELFDKFKKDGYNYTQARRLSRMNESTRDSYFKEVARKKTAEFSLQAKADKIKRNQKKLYYNQVEQSANLFISNLNPSNSKNTVITETKKVQSEQAKDYLSFVSPSTSIQGTDPTIPKSAKKIFLPGSTLATPQVQMFSESKDKQKAREIANKGGIKGFIASVYLAKESREQAGFEASRARAKGSVVGGLGYSLIEFGLSVPIGAVNIIKSAKDPINTIGSIFDPKSYVQAGQEIATRPAKFVGETAGAIALQAGVFKGVSNVQNLNKLQNNPPSTISSKNINAKSAEFQSRFPKQGEGVDIVTTKELKKLQIPEGKGTAKEVLFTSKVVRDPKTGKLIRTPEIAVLKQEIPGNPSRLGTIYYSENYAYTSNPIKLSSDVQSSFSKPQVVATSKWMPGDVRSAVTKTVRGETRVYVPDYFGGQLRPYNPSEFTLSTVYPNRPGLTPGQASTINLKELSYSKTVQTPFGDVTLTNKPSKGVQTTLKTQTKPQTKEIIEITKASEVKPATTEVKTSSELISQVTVQKTQQYATAGEVLEGTLKVQPKTTLAEPIIIESTSKPSFVTKPKPASKNPTVITPIISNNPARLIDVSSVELNQINVINSKNKLNSEIKLNIASKDIMAYSQDVSSTSKSAVVALPALNSKTDIFLDVESISAQLTDQKFKLNEVPPREKIPTTPKPPLRPLEIFKPAPPINPKINKQLEESKSVNTFKIQVRKKGVFKEIATATNLKEAFNIGTQNVLSTASASFKIIGKETELKNNISKKFYQSKKEPGVFIQKREFRISSPGEKKEITLRGLQKLKTKKSIWRF